jgi:hypothetical protein
MKTLAQLREELIDDTVDSCANDYGYLRSAVQDYVSSMDEDEDEIRYRHQCAFEGMEDE